MKLRLLCAGLVLAAALSAAGCSCCHKGCTTPAISSAPPCCPAPVPAPAPCCPGSPAGVVPGPVGAVSGSPYAAPTASIH